MSFGIFGLKSAPISEIYDEALTRPAPVETPVSSAEVMNEALEIWRTLAEIETETTGLSDLPTRTIVQRTSFLHDPTAANLRLEKKLLELHSDLLTSVNEKRDCEIAALRAQLQTRGAEIAAFRAQLQTRGAEIADLRAELETRTREITSLRSSLSEMTDQAAKLKFGLDEIKKSTVWKIAKPTWKLERWLSSRSTTHSNRRVGKARRVSSHAIKPPARNGQNFQPALSAAVLPREYRNAAIVIIVPVYNAASDLEACLASLIAHTSRPASILIIDDASTDPAIPPLLDRFSVIAGITVLRNERNLGFTLTVNKGINLAGRADVVLLNSDAVVTPRWLENLHLAAYSHHRIATVTPLSDNAGAFSVPEYGQANPRPALDPTKMSTLA